MSLHGQRAVGECSFKSQEATSAKQIIRHERHCACCNRAATFRLETESAQNLNPCRHFVLFFVVAACLAARAAGAAPAEIARIPGIVVDEAGKPVAHALVYEARGESTPVRSGEDGRFTLEVKNARLRFTRLFAGSEGDSLLATWHGEIPSDANAHETPDARLVLKPSRAVPVRVVDAAGKPVPGAKLAVEHDYSVMAFADSDDRGRATLRVLSEGKIRNVLAMKPGVGYDYAEMAASPDAMQQTQITLTLDGASHFQVRAVDSKGKPIAGVPFCPWNFQKTGKQRDLNVFGGHPSFPLTRVTDAEGLATFDFLPVSLIGNLSLLCTSREWHQQRAPDWTAKLAAEAQPVVLQTTLLRRPKVSGLVLHADGKPAAGILLQAEGRGKTNHYFREFIRTRSDGTFEFAVYPEQGYLIAVAEKEWAAASHRGLIAREGEDRSDVFLTLGKGTRVHGTVFNSATGKPLAGQTITVIEQGEKIPEDSILGPWSLDSQVEQLVRWTETDAQGRYSIRLGPGAYEISAAYSDDGRGLLVVKEGTPEEQRDFHLGAAK
jgi:hypothetical protein